MTRLREFSYVYDKGSGPLPEAELKKEEFTKGNCRLAIQYFLYKTRGLYLEPREILLPFGYHNVGTFIFKEEPIRFDALKRGDVIYAENLKNRTDKPLQRGRKNFETEDEWVLYFHTAIFLGELDEDLLHLLPDGDYPSGVQLIWHSTNISGGTSVWPVSKFTEYYNPVSAKRLV